jgi:hypothetical protein
MALQVQIQGIEEFKADVAGASAELRKQAKWAMSQSVNVVKNTAQNTVNYKTGTLRRSIYTDITSDGFQGSVVQDSSIAPYGIDIEYGTRAHEIVPVNKKALFWKGALNPYKRVMHPGYAGKPFMQPALENNLQAITDYFSTALKNVVLKMAGKA